MRGSLRFFSPFFSPFFHFFRFSSLKKNAPLPPPRSLPKTSLFLQKNLIFKSRFWVREEGRKKKEERADRNRSLSTIARTGTFCYSRAWKPLSGIRMYSMTMSGTCATHVLTKAKPKAVWSRRLRCMQVSLCWWSVNCCVQACKQTQRDTQGTKRAKCAHVGDTNNTPPHAIRESGVIQTSNRARVWQIWEAREDT